MPATKRDKCLEIYTSHGGEGGGLGNAVRVQAWYRASKKPTTFEMNAVSSRCLDRKHTGLRSRDMFIGMQNFKLALAQCLSTQMNFFIERRCCPASQTLITAGTDDRQAGCQR